MNLGRVHYLSILKEASLVIGNSSSGIIEAPVAGTPTVNIGNRQQGRLKSPSIIDCEESAESIVTAIENVLSPKHQNIAAKRKSLFGHGGSSERIRQILETTSLEGILIKGFHDLGAA